MKGTNGCYDKPSVAIELANELALDPARREFGPDGLAGWPVRTVTSLAGV